MYFLAYLFNVYSINLLKTRQDHFLWKWRDYIIDVMKVQVAIKTFF